MSLGCCESALCSAFRQGRGLRACEARLICAIRTCLRSRSTQAHSDRDMTTYSVETALDSSCPAFGINDEADRWLALYAMMPATRRFCITHLAVLRRCALVTARNICSLLVPSLTLGTRNVCSRFGSHSQACYNIYIEAFQRSAGSLTPKSRARQECSWRTCRQRMQLQLSRIAIATDNTASKDP